MFDEPIPDSRYLSDTYLCRKRKFTCSIWPGGATAPTNGAFLELKDGEDWISLIYDAGLFIAGLDQGGNLKTYTTRGTTVTAGIFGIEAEMPSPWRVTRDEVMAHQADYADNGVIDNPIPSIFSWPGRGIAIRLSTMVLNYYAGGLSWSCSFLGYGLRWDI